MSKPGFALLQDVIMDADFPDLDLALRRGRHVDRDDAAWYALLSDAQEQLEPFYRRYGCELIHKTDGYFYLLPTGDKISRKQLAPTDMLVGQALALLYLDPANVERGGVIAYEDLVAQLSSVLGSDALIAAFNPSTSGGKRKKYDERIAQRNVRSRVAEAVRRLSSMGFVDATEDDRVRLRPALMRFAEPVRGLSEPAAALAKLVALGEVALTPELEEDEDATALPLAAAAADAQPELAADAEALGADCESGVDADGEELGADVESSWAHAELSRDVPGTDFEAGEALGADGESYFDTSSLDGEPGELGSDAESAGVDAFGPGVDAESSWPRGDSLVPGASDEAQPDRPDAEHELAAGSGEAEPVHPLDRDLDWADILPDPPEPEERE